MTDASREAAFEVEVCDALSVGGWLYEGPGDAGYDKERALFPTDVLGWLEQTQPEQLTKVVKPGLSDKAKSRAEAAILDRLVEVLDTPLEHGGGTINVLRQGFSHLGAKFAMTQPRPVTDKNPDLIERYGKTRLRVVRQVHYSTKNNNSIDLVLFVNGLPTATLELKTDTKQSVADAIRQYQQDRPPKGEPLLSFGHRAIVHFAVSNDEVHMTTKLEGPDTRFRPFNRGDDGASGNPPDPDGSATTYLWRDVLESDSWLHILERLVMVETRTDTDPITRKKSRSTSLIFPRFHQWDAVTKLLAAARTEGTGHNYLIQHSAGSGKTKTIAWTAHGLSNLHDADDNRIFQSVVIITDRRVLDDQLQEAVWQIDRTKGVVQPINQTEAAIQLAGREGSKAKSALLAQSLVDGVPIVVVTLQTFPFVLDAIRDTDTLVGKRFAVIADEAHSSQTGTAAAKLREVLSPAQLAELADGGEVSTEDVLAAQMSARADATNISYFAFTATPKPKTLQLFGREDDEGEFVAFHTYTMQQAIEEGYILDVLQNYTPYKTAMEIAKQLGDGSVETTDLVDKTKATRGLLRWVKLHPTNISQKVAIIVEHYRSTVQPLIGGHAKAMVVTDSRKAAVRYKKALDKYISDHGYGEVTSLVAFSGEVVDTDSGPEPFTERNMNPELRGRDLADAFATDEYRVMIVANKFQTGFDQPLLAAMYVDKKLGGVNTVQTLSRLNRIYPGKDQTYILDFVNDPDDVLAEFTQYYRDARLEIPTNPNLIHTLAAKLDAAGIYMLDDVNAAVDALVVSKKNNAIARALEAPKRRFAEAHQEAHASDDEVELDRLDTFRSDVNSYIRLYGFLSQIIDYGDVDIERRAIFFRLLAPQLVTPDPDNPVDLSGVSLVKIMQKEGETRHLKLGDGDDDSGEFTGPGAVGSRQTRDPQMVLFDELIKQINSWFEDDFPDGTAEGWIEAALAVLVANPDLVTQAKKNAEDQFIDSPALERAITAAVLSNRDSHGALSGKYIESEDARAELIQVLGRVLFHRINDGEEGAL